MRTSKIASLIMLIFCAGILTGCTNQGVNGIGKSGIGPSTVKEPDVVTLRGSLILPVEINQDLLTSVLPASGSDNVGSFAKNSSSFVNGRRFDISIDEKTLGFIIPDVPTSVEKTYRIDVVMGKIGLKTVANAPNDIILTTRTTAAVLVADRIKENPIELLASHSRELLNLSRKLETAFKADVASISESIFALEEITREVLLSAESIKNGSNSSGTVPLSPTSSATGANTASKTPPVVSIMSPSSGSSFEAGSNIVLYATATDTDGTIVKVEFFQNDVKLGEALQEPYRYVWENPAQGSFAITAKAVNALGEVAVSEKISISTYLEPVIMLLTPVTGTRFNFGDDITINAFVSGIQENLMKVEFYQGMSKIGEALRPPYTFRWVAPPVGAYTLSVSVGPVSSDSDIPPVFSEAAGVEVKALPNKEPGISLIAPLADARIPSGSDVTLTALASDSDGYPVRVEFFQGIIKLGEALSPPFSSIWKTPQVGTYSIFARVTDNAGGQKKSEIVTFGVFQQKSIQPTIRMTAPPENAAFAEGSDIQISVLAQSETGTIGKVEFFQGSIKIGENATVPYSFAWRSVPFGRYTLSAKVVDTLGRSSTSDPVLINVLMNQPPLASITKPLKGSSIKAGTDLNIVVDASDPNGGISHVECYINGLFLGDIATPPYNFTYRKAAQGQIGIVARAFDNFNVFANSLEVQVTATP